MGLKNAFNTDNDFVIKHKININRNNNNNNNYNSINCHIFHLSTVTSYSHVMV